MIHYAFFWFLRIYTFANFKNFARYVENHGKFLFYVHAVLFLDWIIQYFDNNKNIA